MFKNILNLSDTEKKQVLAYDWTTPRNIDKSNPQSPHYEGPDAGEWDADPIIERYIDLNALFEDAFYYEDAMKILRSIEKDARNGIYEGIIRDDTPGTFKEFKQLLKMIKNITDYVDVSDFPQRDPDPPDVDIY